MRIGSLGVTRPNAAAVVVAAFVGYAMSGCGSEPRGTGNGGDSGSPRVAASEADNSGPSWRDYLPAHAGRTCEISSDIDGETVVGVRRTVKSATDTAQGRRVVLETNLVSGAPAVQQTFVATPDGALQDFPINVLQYSAEMRITRSGFVGYPSLAELRRGRSMRSTLTVDITPKTQAGRDSMSSEGMPIPTRMHFTMKTSAAPDRGRISTGAGEFTDIVGVRRETLSAEIEGASGTAAEQLSQGIGLTGDATTYFARGRGPVMTTQTVGGKLTTDTLRRCDT
jgi:hypothetical protein